MASDNHVSSRTPLSFGSYRLASGTANLAATGNALVAMPVLGGGLTNSGANVTSGAAIVRRITVSSLASGDIHTANVSVGYTNDGANLVANAQTLTNITANGTYQDLTLSAYANTTMISGNVSPTLYVNLVANAAATGLVEVRVYGELVKA